MKAIKRKDLRIGNIYISKYAIMRVIRITDDSVTTCKDWVIDSAPDNMKNAPQYVTYNKSEYMHKKDVLKIEHNEIDTAKVLMMVGGVE